MKAGDLVWINYDDVEDVDFSYNGPGRIVRRWKPSEHCVNVGASFICDTPDFPECLFPESTVRTIATAAELKRLATTNQGG